MKQETLEPKEVKNQNNERFEMIALFTLPWII